MKWSRVPTYNNLRFLIIIVIGIIIVDVSWMPIAPENKSWLFGALSGEVQRLAVSVTTCQSSVPLTKGQQKL